MSEDEPRGSHEGERLGPVPPVPAVATEEAGPASPDGRAGDDRPHAAPAASGVPPALRRASALVLRRDAHVRRDPVPGLPSHRVVAGGRASQPGCARPPALHGVHRRRFRRCRRSSAHAPARRARARARDGNPLSQLAPRRAKGLGALRRHTAHGRDRRLPAAGARLDGAAARHPRRADRGLGARFSARGIRHDRRAGRGRCPHRHDRSARDLRHRHRHIWSVGVRTRAHARRSAAEGRRAAERPAASSRE